MKKIVGFILLIFNFLLFTSFALANGDGGLPGYFLTQGAGARALALGRSFTAISDDATAMFFNPGGLFQLQRKELQYMYANLFEGTQYRALSFSQSGAGVVTFALGAVQLRSAGFIERDEYNYPTGKEFVDENTAILLSSCFKIEEDKLGVGLNLKHIMKKIDTFNKSGFDTDVGFLYSPLPELSFGLNIQNLLGAKFKRESLTDELPMNIKLGIAGKLFHKAITVSADLDNTDKRSAKSHFGIEYRVKEILGLRVGYDISYITAGFGVSYKHFYLDYALLSHTELELSHRVSLGVRFGRSKEDIILEKHRIAREEEQKRERTKELFRQGEEYFMDMDWQGAVTNFEQVLIFDENNQTAKDKLAKAKQNLELINNSMKKGQQLFKNRDFDGAISEFDKVLVLNPQNTEAQEYKKWQKMKKLKRQKE
ncbi:MAG: PorV/PorQ family protein [Elusimicrobiota bacterium]